MATEPIRIPIRNLTKEIENVTADTWLIADDGLAMGKAKAGNAVDARATSIVNEKIAELSLGTASQSNVEDFATAAQGGLADTAMQPATYDPTNVAADAFDSANHAYSNASSGLTASTAKAALDELAGRDVIRVANRTALAALDVAKTQAAIVYAEGGRNGTFTFVPGDHSAEVAADALEGIYVAPNSDATGASGAWVRQGAFSGSGLNIEWFGAVANSVTDCTPAVQAAHDLLPPSTYGGVIFIPPSRSGFWRIASTVNISKRSVTVLGLDRECTVIFSSTGHNFHFFNVTANGFKLRNIKFQTSGTTGTTRYFLVYAPQIHGLTIKDVSAVNIHSGFYNNGAEPVYENVNLRTLKAGQGIGWDFEEDATGEVKRIFHCSIVNADDAEPYAGIRIRHGGSFEIIDTQLMQCGIAIMIAPRTGKRVLALTLNNVWCDTSNTCGILIAGEAGSSVERVRIENSWLSSCQYGLRALSQVRGVKIIGCEIYDNDQYGIALQGTGAALKGFVVEGCSIADSGGDGIYIGSGYTDFQIIGNHIGPDADFPGNTSAAIRLAGSNDSYTIIGNSVAGNGASIVGHSPSTTKIAMNNIGYTTVNRGTATIASGNTEVTVTHGLAGTPSDTQIQITPRSGLEGGVSWWVASVGSTTFKIVVGAAVGGDISFAWRAALE